MIYIYLLAILIKGFKIIFVNVFNDLDPEMVFAIEGEYL